MPTFSNPMCQNGSNDPLSIAQSANAAFSPSYIPVMVITGATSGIGKAMTEAFARYLKGRVHIVLVGRNKDAAESIIASLPTSEDSTYEFIASDITLMKNVHALAEDLLARLPKVNFLVHCAGVFGLGGRQDTEEGIDFKLASRYYSRWALINDLLPLLRKAKDLGESASVLSVLAAGKGPEVNLDDLGLKKSYSGMKAMMQSICYNDLMVAEFAEREPEIAFTHIYPGNVDTPALNVSNPLLKSAIFVLRPIVWRTTPETCAEYMLFALLDAQKGVYRRNEMGENIDMKNFPQAKDAQKLVWEHSVQETTIKS